MKSIFVYNLSKTTNTSQSRHSLYFRPSPPPQPQRYSPRIKEIGQNVSHSLWWAHRSRYIQ